MQKGNAAMGIFSSANIYDLDPGVVAEGGKIAYACPAARAIGRGRYWCFLGFGLGINKDSKSKDAAWDFIKVVAGKPAQIRMATELATARRVPVSTRTRQSRPKTPRLHATMEALKVRAAQGSVSKWPEIEDALGVRAQPGAVAEKAADHAISDASKRIGTIIGA